MQPVLLPTLIERTRGVVKRAGSAVAIIAALSTFGLMPSGANAQGLLDSLFGSSKPSYRPLPQTYPLPNRYLSYAPSSAGSSSGFESGGSYRTMCVRMCDGFYFPISYGVSRSQFSRDAAACQTSCGTEARLFYHPTNSTPDTMVDLSGRPYSSIPNAFKYRKTLVDHCACRSAPWTEAEMARHQRYAATEARGKAGADPAPAAVAAASRPAGQDAGKVASADQLPQRPAPVVTERSTVQEQVTVGRLAVARPAPVAVERTPEVGMPPNMKPQQARMSVGAAPAANAKPSKASQAKGPVYSHDLGRFVFPGETH